MDPKVDGLEPNWTVIRLKVDGPNESNGESGRSRSLKVDGSKVFSCFGFIGFEDGFIDFEDGCWRQNVLMTTLKF